MVTVYCWLLYTFQPVKTKLAHGNDIIAIDPKRQVKGIKPELFT